MVHFGRNQMTGRLPFLHLGKIEAVNDVRASLVAQTVKHLPTIQETRVQSLGEENGNPLQYSCLENPMDGRAW